MPKNPMLRALMNKVNIPGMPRPDGTSSKKSAVAGGPEMQIHRKGKKGKKPKGGK